MGTKESPTIRLHCYSGKSHEIHDFSSVENALAALPENGKFWLRISNMKDLNMLNKVGDHFDYHPLTIEDIANRKSLPKIEDFEQYLHIILKFIFFDKEKDSLQSEQISIILGNDYVISFAEKKLGFFDEIEERLDQENSRIRKLPSDFLAYRLVDTVVDGYFDVMNAFQERLSKIELQAFSQHHRIQPEKLYRLKRKAMQIQKVFLPTNEMISGILRKPTPTVSTSTMVYFRDLLQHTTQIIENLESSKETMTSIIDIAFSHSAERTNKIVKVLTIVSAIFLPLNFLVGFFGMNFTSMPMIKEPFGFWVAFSGMLSLAVGCIIYFRKKNGSKYSSLTNRDWLLSLQLF